jgi:hypothetical protein
MKKALLALVLATGLGLAACNEQDGNPSSPSRSGSAVGATTTISGVISRMSRSGPNGIDVTFRVGDEVFMRGDAGTVVIAGSATGNTTYLREGQIATVDAQQRSGHVYARRVIVN